MWDARGGQWNAGGRLGGCRRARRIGRLRRAVIWSSSVARGAANAGLAGSVAQAQLAAHPTAGIGEIGLDRWMKGHDLAMQTEVFLAQLESRRRRESSRATIHCLKAWGALTLGFD